MRPAPRLIAEDDSAWQYELEHQAAGPAPARAGPSREGPSPDLHWPAFPRQGEADDSCDELLPWEEGWTPAVDSQWPSSIFSEASAGLQPICSSDDLELHQPPELHGVADDVQPSTPADEDRRASRSVSDAQPVASPPEHREQPQHRREHAWQYATHQAASHSHPGTSQQHRITSFVPQADMFGFWE